MDPLIALVIGLPASVAVVFLALELIRRRKAAARAAEEAQRAQQMAASHRARYPETSRAWGGATQRRSVAPVASPVSPEPYPGYYANLAASSYHTSSASSCETSASSSSSYDSGSSSSDSGSCSSSSGSD